MMITYPRYWYRQFNEILTSSNNVTNKVGELVDLYHEVENIPPRNSELMICNILHLATGNIKLLMDVSKTLFFDKTKKSIESQEITSYLSTLSFEEVKCEFIVHLIMHQLSVDRFIADKPLLLMKLQLFHPGWKNTEIFDIFRSLNEIVDKKNLCLKLLEKTLESDIKCLQTLAIWNIAAILDVNGYNYATILETLFAALDNMSKETLLSMHHDIMEPSVNYVTVYQNIILIHLYQNNSFHSCSHLSQLGEVYQNIFSQDSILNDIILFDLKVLDSNQHIENIVNQFELRSIQDDNTVHHCVLYCMALVTEVYNLLKRRDFQTAYESHKVIMKNVDVLTGSIPDIFVSRTLSQIYHLAGYISVLHGDFKDAVNYFSTAVSYNPYNYYARYNHILMLIKLGDFRAAMERLTDSTVKVLQRIFPDISKILTLVLKNS